MEIFGNIVFQNVEAFLSKKKKNTIHIIPTSISSIKCEEKKHF